ncbi:MAG: efflux RND transporter periplasmic adaptor subunit [Peptostreptococcaceae bacterium]
MKKIGFKNKLSKKQKLIVGVTSLFMLTGGVVTFSIVRDNILEKQLMESRVDLYEVPGQEKVFLKGKVVPIKSEELFVNEGQGQLDQIKVEDRAFVEKGAPLFTCKNNEQIKEISNLKLQVEAKKKEKNAAIDEEMKKTIDEEIKQLNKQIDELNKTAYSTVYAPFSGKAYINEDKSVGKPVIILETTEFYVKGQVNERDSYKIKLRQGVEVKAMATNDKYSGKIIDIGDKPLNNEDLDGGYSSDSGMSQYRVKVSIEKQDNLKNGLNVQMTALSGSSDKKIPTTAVIQESGSHYVYKVENETVYKIDIKVKEEKDDYYIVESGVNEGDEIITDALSREFKDGDKVYTGKEEIDI